MFSSSSELPTATTPADPLSEILQDLRLARVGYGRCELTGPWGLDFAPQRAARFHFVALGECWLRTPALGWTALHAGDVVLLPHGTGHSLTDRRGGRGVEIDALPQELIGEQTYRLRTGGAGALTLLACCSVGFEEPSLHPLLALMPPVLLVRGDDAGAAALTPLLDAMTTEVRDQRVGAATVLARLADVVITRIIRAWIEGRSDDTVGWLAAIRDPQIGRALTAIHRQPGEPWSVEALAEVAMMSRSVFSARFAAVVGVPPARYLAGWRMHLASGWLRRDRLTVAEVTARLGYESEAAFSRAFKQRIGVPPSALRGSTPQASSPTTRPLPPSDAATPPPPPPHDTATWQSNPPGDS